MPERIISTESAQYQSMKRRNSTQGAQVSAGRVSSSVTKPGWEKSA